MVCRMVVYERKMSVFNNLVQQLAQAQITSPRLEARMLLAYLLHRDNSETDIITAELTTLQQKELDELVDRRVNKHEPIDKIIGKKGFYKFDFIVNNDVLSPRPETEIIIEEALSLGKIDSILDLGTGSGCILLSLLKELPQAQGTGVDISNEALSVAKQNARMLEIENQVKWINASWNEENFLKHFPYQFNLVVSNPPYIPNQEIMGLDPEVKNYDPLLALSGGEDGYDAYHRLAEIIPHLLTDKGAVLLECGQGQAETVADIFMKQNLSLYKIVKDLQGIDRCIILKK